MNFCPYFTVIGGAGSRKQMEHCCDAPFIGRNSMLLFTNRRIGSQITQMGTDIKLPVVFFWLFVRAKMLADYTNERR